MGPDQTQISWEDGYKHGGVWRFRSYCDCACVTECYGDVFVGTFRAEGWGSADLGARITFDGAGNHVNNPLALATGLCLVSGPVLIHVPIFSVSGPILTPFSRICHVGADISLCSLILPSALVVQRTRSSVSACLDRY